MESVLEATQMASSQSPSVVALWDLDKPTTETIPEAEFLVAESLAAAYKNGSESVLGADGRKLVANKHFAPGGKYRSIVKILGRMEGQKKGAPWMMATGWLVRDDLVVTAGHVACDWDHKLGLLKEIKCYIGYYGRDKTKNPHVQSRHGVTVAAPYEWLRGPNSVYDVAFIKLDKPFTDVTPFRFFNTPAKGTLTLGVVGYPGDLKNGGKYGGERMYEMFLRVPFNLADNKRKMLTYEIDTFGGNSGSPVLKQNGMEAIGVHVLGGTKNSASVIGPLGNNFHSFISSFKRKGEVAKLKNVKNFRIVSVSSIESPVVVRPNIPGKRIVQRVDFTNGAAKRSAKDLNGETDDGEAGAGEAVEGDPEDPEGTGEDVPGDAEGLFSFIKTAATAIMGLSGGPVGAIASAALTLAPAAMRAMRRRKKESADGDEAQEDFDEADANAEAEDDGEAVPVLSSGKSSVFPPGFAGSPARAILAQAALQSMMTLSPSVLDQHGVFQTMSKTVQKYQQSARKINPVLARIVQPTALDIMMEEVKRNRARTQPRPTSWMLAPKQKMEGAVAEGFEGFVDGFTTEFSAEESELSSEAVNDIVREALSEGSLGLEAESFEFFESMLPGTEAEQDGGVESIAPSASLEGLAEGAVLAEAALEALKTLPADVMQREGLFGAIAGVIKKVAPVVIKWGPRVLRAMNSNETSGAEQESALTVDPFEATIETATRNKRASVADEGDLSAANGVADSNGFKVEGTDDASQSEEEPPQRVAIEPPPKPAESVPILDPNVERFTKWLTYNARASARGPPPVIKPQTQQGHAIAAI